MRSLILNALNLQMGGITLRDVDQTTVAPMTPLPQPLEQPAMRHDGSSLLKVSEARRSPPTKKASRRFTVPCSMHALNSKTGCAFIAVATLPVQATDEGLMHRLHTSQGATDVGGCGCSPTHGSFVQESNAFRILFVGLCMGAPGPWPTRCSLQAAACTFPLPLVAGSTWFRLAEFDTRTQPRSAGACGCESLLQSLPLVWPSSI